MEGCSGGVSRPSRGAHFGGNQPWKCSARLPPGGLAARSRMLRAPTAHPPAHRFHAIDARPRRPPGTAAGNQPKSGCPAAGEGVWRSCGSGALAGGWRARAAGESVRQGAPAEGVTRDSKADFRRNDRVAKHPKSRENTPPKRCPKRATKNVAISIIMGVARRPFCTKLDAGFRWPFALLRSVKIWPAQARPNFPERGAKRGVTRNIANHL